MGNDFVKKRCKKRFRKQLLHTESFLLCGVELRGLASIIFRQCYIGRKDKDMVLGERTFNLPSPQCRIFLLRLHRTGHRSQFLLRSQASNFENRCSKELLRGRDG